MAVADIEVVGYSFVILLTVLWTVLALDRKSFLLSLLSTMFWFVLAQINVSYMADTVLMPMSWLYYGLGGIFMIYSFALIFMGLMRLSKSRKEEEAEVWV